MKISVFGLGYVGCTSAACLAELGHIVTGVDINKEKVDLVNSGMATVVEDGLDELVSENVSKGRLKATENAMEAVIQSEISLVCVPTPAGVHGQPDLSYIQRVAKQIGKILRSKNEYHTVVLRSTVPPGTTDRIGEILTETSGKKLNKDFAVAHNPEFLREGSSIDDFMAPPMIVIASSSNKAEESLKSMYQSIDKEIVVVSLGVSEMLKYVNNTYHALKVVFANEIARICRVVDVDEELLMDVFCKDRVLNISDAYMKPGFAYGGSCLPKDLTGLTAMAYNNHIPVPVISSIEKSNSEHIDYVFRQIISANVVRVAVIGLSFKPGTDDLRNSPAVDLLERLIGKGYEVSVYDPRVVYSKLTGRNKRFIDTRLPHIARILHGKPEKALEDAELVVFLQNINVPDSLVEGRQVIRIHN